MRRLVIAAVLLAVTCRDEDNSGGHIRTISSGISSTADATGPDVIRTYEFEMPQGWNLTWHGRDGRATLVDESGRSLEAQGWGGSRSSSRPDTFRASFRVPDEFQPVFLRVQNYEVDLRHGRIRKTQTPAP